MSKSPSKHLFGYVLVALAVFLYFHIPQPIAYDPQRGPVSPPVVQNANASADRSTDAAKPEPCESFYQVVCGRRAVLADPTGVVQPDVKGEVEALRLYEKLIHDNPTATSEEVDEKLVAELYTPQRRKKLFEVFDWVRATMIRVIDSQPSRVFSRQAKAELLQRLRATSLDLPPPVSLYRDELDVFTKNDVFYEQLADGRRVIRIGGAYLLAAKSWFNRVFTFAHELAHAIDPCEVDPVKGAIPEFARLERCFLQQGYIKVRDGGVCGAGGQFSEAFSDWIGAQIAAEALKSYGPKFKGPQEIVNSVINSVRDLCSEDSWLEYNTDVYPEPQIRIGRIFGGNPGVRAVLGCRAGAPSAEGRREVTQSDEKNAYCSFGGG